MNHVRFWWVVYSIATVAAFFGLLFAGQKNWAEVVGAVYIGCVGVLFAVGTAALLACFWLERKRPMKFPAINPEMIPPARATRQARRLPPDEDGMFWRRNADGLTSASNYPFPTSSTEAVADAFRAPRPWDGKP